MDYSLKIKSTSSNKNLINPFFIFEEIQINDNENKELVYIPNLKIGVNLIESLIQEYLSLSVLEIDTLKSSQGSSRETFQPFLIKGNKLKISNNNKPILFRLKVSFSEILELLSISFLLEFTMSLYIIFTDVSLNLKVCIE